MSFSCNISLRFLLVALLLGTSAASRIHRHSHNEFDSQLQALQKERRTSELGEKWTQTASTQNEEASASLLVQKDATVDLQLAFQEFLGMALFVFIGCGSAMSVAKRDCSNGWILQVALTFGFAIFVLVQSGIGNQINCAVTLGLTMAQQLHYHQGLFNFVAQMLGSVAGAAILKFMFPIDKDLTGDLGTNVVASGWTFLGAFVGEFIGTLLLVVVVLTKKQSQLHSLVIGLAVFLAHSVLIPVDGCSINPTRSFGPAVVQAVTGKHREALTQLWIFWVGPLSGAACAVLLYWQSTAE